MTALLRSCTFCAPIQPSASIIIIIHIPRHIECCLITDSLSMLWHSSHSLTPAHTLPPPARSKCQKDKMKMRKTKEKTKKKNCVKKTNDENWSEIKLLMDEAPKLDYIDPLVSLFSSFLRSSLFFLSHLWTADTLITENSIWMARRRT